MAYIGIAILCIIIFKALVSGSPSSQADIANMQLEQAQKQQDSGPGFIIALLVLAVIVVALAGAL